MNQNQIRDWNEDREEEMIAARKQSRWWPLLLVPLAFFIGWGVNEAGDRTTDMSSSYSAEQGIGGSGNVQCDPAGVTTE